MFEAKAEAERSRPMPNRLDRGQAQNFDPERPKEAKISTSRP